MAGQIRFLEGGAVTTPKGYVAGATFAGMKTYAEDKLDLGILLSQRPAVAAGVFTTSTVRSACVTLTQRNIGKGPVRALVVNSGIANACVGDQGLKDAEETARLAAKLLKLEPREVVVGSTGLIGVELPMALIKSSLGRIQLTSEGGHGFARAIVTTDSHPKEVAVTFRVGAKSVTIGGACKGSGMIHPNMATMLAYIATDATVEQPFLQKALKEAADASFNMISVDGDTSTNDTALLFANGAAEADPIQPGTPAADTFQEALTAVCVHLAKEIARDGEGATRLLEVTVEGAKTLADARAAARTIASSNLVKSAVHGGDPNWGRIMAALGRSGADVEESKVALYVTDVCIMENGLPIPYHKDSIVVLMRQAEVAFRLNLNLGSKRAIAWGCDLSEEYVTFNSAYTT
ncbi:MAG: bifunctional glutamate N-acetyltransferase/amino-acid acetyltransferase ArgJ [Chloroflexota bacterium]|nr:bifunctional glutamate N-acetyltransferase/amino-acid acetyltransferase ArgJ [Chloroflexota bacterium]